MTGISLKQFVPLTNLYFLLLSISLHNPQWVPFEIYIDVSHKDNGTQISKGSKLIFPFGQFSFTFTHLFPSRSKRTFWPEEHSSTQSLPSLLFIAQTLYAELLLIINIELECSYPPFSSTKVI